MAVILSVRGLTVRFGQRVVIEGLSFELQQGDILAVLGPNGSGKTVLLKALLGLVGAEGEIRWAPEARIGYVPQKVAPDRALPVRVREILEAKARVLGLPGSVVEEAAGAAGLSTEVLESVAGVLSGGQFQKVLLAYALLGAPNVLLVDEPTASLDELSEERVYELLHHLQVERKLTVILVSHELSVVFRYANRVLCLSRGFTCAGSPSEVLTQQTLEALYGSPQSYYLHVVQHHRQESQ